MADYRGRRANTCPDLDSMVDYETLPRFQRSRVSSVPPGRNRASSGGVVRTRAASYDSLARAKMRAESLRAAGHGSYDSLQGGDMEYQLGEYKGQYGDLKVHFGGSGGNFGESGGHFGEADSNFGDSSYTRFGLSASTSRILSDSTYNRFISGSGYSRFGRSSSGSRFLNNSSLRRFSAKDSNQNSFSPANFSYKSNLINSNKKSEDLPMCSNGGQVNSRNNSLTSSFSESSGYNSNSLTSPGSPEQQGGVGGSGRFSNGTSSTGSYSKIGGGTVGYMDTLPSPSLAKLSDTNYYSSNTWSPSRPRGQRKGNEGVEERSTGGGTTATIRGENLNGGGGEGAEVRDHGLHGSRRVSDGGYSSLGTLSSVRKDGLVLTVGGKVSVGSILYKH